MKSGSPLQATPTTFETAVGAAATGVVAASAEAGHFFAVPWAATGLSLLFLAIAAYFVAEWRRPEPAELGAAEMSSEPIAMAAASGAKEQLITVEKPLGLSVGVKKSTGGVEISFVNPLGNAAKAGLKAGDTVIYTSSFFGDELWPADKLAFTRSAINACPNAVDFIIVRGPAGDEINVKRLPKRPAPPKIGRKLTAAQKERATHICLDCGWIYALPTSFDEQDADYRCPQCQARKSRFAKYDVETGKVIGSSALPQGVLAGVLGGAAFVLILGYVALSL